MGIRRPFAGSRVESAPARPTIVQRILPQVNWGYGRSDRGGYQIRFIVNHVAVGNGSLYGWFLNSPNNPKTGPLSTHYWISKTGVIEQYVPDSGAAYGQGITSAGSNFPPEYPGNGEDYNKMCLSAEREGYPYEEPTAPQWASIVALNRWLAFTYSVPVDGDHIVAHARTDHIDRANCPSSPSLPTAAYMAKLVAAVKGA